MMFIKITIRYICITGDTLGYVVHFINTVQGKTHNCMHYQVSCICTSISPRPVGGGGRSHHNCLGPASGIQIEVLGDNPPHY